MSGLGGLGGDVVMGRGHRSRGAWALGLSINLHKPQGVKPRVLPICLDCVTPKGSSGPEPTTIGEWREASRSIYVYFVDFHLIMFALQYRCYCIQCTR